MRITWYGHAAFLIETEGKRIILDPYRYPDAGGYLPVDDHADAVIVSHENDRYHSHLGQIREPFEVARALEFGPEGREVAGIRIFSTRVYETPEKLPEDEVTIIRFRSEGLCVVFLGDLGHLLSEEEVEPLRGADVLLAAAGGTPTIDLSEIPALFDAIQPRVVLPMHYKTPKINLNIKPLESFLDVLPDWPVRWEEGATIELTRDRLPKTRTIVCLKHLR